MIVWLSGSAVTEVKGEWDKRLKKESTVATRKVRGNGPNSKGGGPTTTNKTESKKNPLLFNMLSYQITRT